MAVRVADSFPREALSYEPIPKWIRGERNGMTVVDSRRTWLVWEPGRVVPGWCFPREDVRMDRFGPARETREHSAEVGEAWALGDVPYAAWTYADPDLAGRLAVDFRALDRWREEEAEVIGHPRDPFKRIDVRRSSRRVRVEADGRLLADSARPVLLFETGLPVRYYLPREDVNVDLLTPSETHTLCAYKGEASYLSAPGAEDIAWFYPDPLPDNAEIRDLVAFLNERVDISVDGEREERPSTQWS